MYELIKEKLTLLNNFISIIHLYLTYNFGFTSKTKMKKNIKSTKK
jgi:hypothetical protein